MIIERRIGYTNEMMLDYCNMLDAVVSKTVDVKTGRALRAYSYTNKKWVAQFVKDHPSLSNLSKREALKHH